MDDPIRKHDGKVLLYRRNGVYQARIHLGKGEYIHRSLKTANTAEAERLAEDLWNDTRYELKNGLPIRKRTLNAVLDEYIRFRERDNEQGKKARSVAVKYTSDANLRQMKRVQHFWREYAGNLAIDRIDNKVLTDYVPWRKDYYRNKTDVSPNASINPADKTLLWEVTFIKTVLRYAKERGYLGVKNVPEYTFTAKNKRVRPAFTLTDFEKLKAGLVDWISKARGPQQQYSRQLLHDYVLVLALSGMRTGAISKLKVRDVQPIKDDEGRENALLNVRHKTAPHVVVPHIDAKAIIDALLARRGDPDPDDWLFVMQDGTQIDNLRDQFDRVLEEYGLTHHADGSKYSLYSLRHFYAVRAITRGVDIYTIARNMGNSVKVIEEYYGKNATTTARATVLGGKSGSYQRVRDDLQMLLLTSEQVYSVAYALAGYEKWLKREQDRELKPRARRKVVEQLLTSAKLKFKSSDVTVVVGEAAQMDTTSMRITAQMKKLFKQIKV
jgi:integrase